MTDRQIASTTCGGRERDADERRLHAARAIADYAHRKTAGFSEIGNQADKCLVRCNNGILCTDGVGRWSELGDKRSKAKRGEELVTLLPIRTAVVEARDVHVR